MGKKTGPNPTDRGKSGTKRSLLTDGTGLPLAIVAAPANRHDVTLVAETLSQLAVPQPWQLRPRPRLCMDLGYDSQSARYCARLMLWQPCLPRRKKPRPGKTGQKKRLRGYSGRTPRCVVERSHSWLNRFRRLLVRWEKREDTYLALLHFACGLISWRTALSK